MGKSWVALCDVNGSCKKPTRSPRISESQRFHKLQGSLDHLCKTLLNQSWKERTCPDNFRCFKQQLSVVSEMSQAHCWPVWVTCLAPFQAAADILGVVDAGGSFGEYLGCLQRKLFTVIFFDFFWSFLIFFGLWFVLSKLIPTNCFNIGFSWSGWNLHFHPMSVTEVGAAVLCTTSRHCEGFAGICGALVGKTNTKHINVSHIMPYRTPCQPWKSACFLSLRCVLFGCLWAGRLLLISRSGSLIGGPSSRLWRNQQTTSSRTEKRMVLDFERSQMLGLHKSNSERHEWLYS